MEPRRITIFSASLALAAIMVLPSAFAANQGTVIVDQKDPRYTGEWGLATPAGPLEGTGTHFQTQGLIGNYSLTVTPPAGAVPTITVFNNNVLTSSGTGVRTAAGKISASGETLKFEISYAFTLIGDVTVTSTPSGMPYKLVSPRGTETGVTPGSYIGVPQGSYSVYYLPKDCPAPRPYNRDLQAQGRISFNFVSECKATQPKPPVKPPVVPVEPEEPEEPEEPTPPPPPPARPTNPVRVALSTGSAEVPKGGTTRFTVRVLNTSDASLAGLTLDFRYDEAQITVQGAPGAQRSANQLSWTLPTLAANAKWEQEFAAKIKDGLPSGTLISATATVRGDAVNDTPVTKRADSAQVAIIGPTALPQTGFDLILFSLAGILLVLPLLTGLAFATVRVRK